MYKKWLISIGKIKNDADYKRYYDIGGMKKVQKSQS